MKVVHTHSKYERMACCTLLLWLHLISQHAVFAIRPVPTELGTYNGSMINSTFSTETALHAWPKPDDTQPVIENNITCVGSGPDLRLPVLTDGFNPNTASMQQLCAKTKYNGGRPGQHAGGYCWTRPGTGSYNHPDNDTTGDVGFDLSPYADASVTLQNPRFLLACFYRCFCNSGLQNSSVQPKSKYAYFRTSMARSLFSYELQLDMDNDFTHSRLAKSGKRGRSRVVSTRVPERSELDQTSSPSAKMGREYITLDPGNEIECRGDLPTFVLPAPYNTSDFNSLQELCATQLNGGNM